MTLFYNVIYSFLAVFVFIAVWAFLLVVASRGYSLVAVCRLLITMTSLVAGHMVPRHLGFSNHERAQ